MHDVEVKGITGREENFIITAGEVKQAKHNSRFVLCVVTQAMSPKATVSSYSGKEFLQHFRLDPVQFRAIPCK
jgi:hypothetical protein